MNIISLVNEFTNIFNETFKTSLNPLNLESKIRQVGDEFTLKLYQQFLNFLNERFKDSKERKENYNIKDTTKKTLITSMGVIEVNCTSYYSKESHKRFVFLREVLNLKPYQRLTNEAEFQLTKYAMDVNMSQAGKYALRNVIISRSTVSKKLAKLDGSVKEKIKKSNDQPRVLYIEMDEIHANLQHGGNCICPCAIIHEGHEENFTKRKQLKNVRNFATSILSYRELFEVIYDYTDKRYDIDKFDYIFISGDGASGIKDYVNCFPNAIFVLDPFHYRHKGLYMIFQNRNIANMADYYLRNDMLDDFNILVNLEIDKNPDRKTIILSKSKYLLNNIDGIKNQHHPSYKCPCSMEGHVSQTYARYITSSPFGFSKRGLENKLKLLVYKANRVNLTIEDYYYLKYGKNEYIEINENIRKMLNLKIDARLTKNTSKSYDINVPIPIFDTPKENNRFKEITSIRQEIYII